MNSQLENNSSVSRQSLRKRNQFTFNKKWILSVSAVLIILIITHLVLKSMYTPERMIDKFKQAVADNNYKEVTQMLEEGGTGATLDETSVKAFMEYMNNPNLTGKLDELASDHTIQKPELIDQHGNHILTIKKGSKFLGIYQTYLISAHAFELKITSPIDEVELHLNKQVNRLKKDEYETSYKKVLPGKYTLQVMYQGEYSEVKDSIDLDFSNASNNKLEQELTFDVSYVEIYSNEPDAILFVNGKDTGKKISEIEKFGPFLLNGETTVHAEVEKDGQILKTDDVPVTGKYIDLLFDEPTTTPTTDHAGQNDTGFFAGLEGFFDKYFPNIKPSSDLEEQQLLNGLFNQNNPAFYESKDYQHKVKKKNTTQKLKSFSMVNSKQDDSGMIITTNETYEITDKKGKVKTKTFQITYHFTRENNELKMDRIEEVKELD